MLAGQLVEPAGGDLVLGVQGLVAASELGPARRGFLETPGELHVVAQRVDLRS